MINGIRKREKRERKLCSQSEWRVAWTSHSRRTDLPFTTIQNNPTMDYSFSDDEDEPQDSFQRQASSSSSIRLDSLTPTASPTRGTREARRPPHPQSPFGRSPSSRPPYQPRGPSPTPSSSTGPEAAEPFVTLPAISRLQRIWVAERTSPELLPWNSSDAGTHWRCDETIDEVCEQIEQQMVSQESKSAQKGDQSS